MTITDPRRLALWAQDQAAETGAPASPNLRGVQLGAGALERVRRVFADDPDERDRLIRAVESREAEPIGRPLWSGLSRWRRDAVLEWARQRDDDRRTAR